MKIQRGLYGVSLHKEDPAEMLAWFVRNDILFNEIPDGYFGVMDKITITRFKRFFGVPMGLPEITQEEKQQFEEFASFNLQLDRDDKGLYTNDLTFQAWQFFKLGKT